MLLWMVLVEAIVGSEVSSTLGGHDGGPELVGGREEGRSR